MYNLFTNGSEEKNIKSLLPSFIKKTIANSTNPNKLNSSSNDDVKKQDFFDMVKKQISEINDKKEHTQIPEKKEPLKTEKKNDDQENVKEAYNSKDLEKTNNENKDNKNTEIKVEEKQDNTKQKISNNLKDLKKTKNEDKKLINKYIKDIELLIGSFENQNIDNKIVVKLEKLLEEFQTKLLKLFESKENKDKNFIEKDLFIKLQSLINQINKKLANIKNSNIINNKDIGLKNDNLFTLNINELKKQIKKLSKKIDQNIVKNNISLHPDTNKEPININHNNSNEFNKLLSSTNSMTNTNPGNNDNEPGSFQFSREFQNNGSQSNTIKNTFNQASAAKNTLFDKQLKEIINKSRMVVKNEKNASMSLRLNPKNLGKVNINLGLENGLLNGKFLVDSQDAKNALLESLEVLKENLGQNGVSIGEFQVNVREQKQFSTNADEKKSFNMTNRKKDNNVAILDQYEKHASLHDGQIDMVI